MRPLTLHARWVLPVTAPPVENGSVSVGFGGRIEYVGPRRRSFRREIDLGSAVVMPGLVNAHTHLDLSPLAGRIARPHDFVSWCEDLLVEKKRIVPRRLSRALRAAVKSLAAAGVTTVGDISSDGASAAFLCEEGLRGVVYRELINPVPFLAWLSIRRLERPPGLTRAPCPSVKYGISPHSPYAASAALYRRSARTARSLGIPLCSHVAESPEELRYLRDGGGALGDFIGRRCPRLLLGRPPGVSPVAYLDSLGLLGRGFTLIHCNYMEGGDLEMVVRSRASVVYCPRSHRFFGRPPYPLEEMLAEGVNVAVGSDSLASSGGLGILDEMRLIGRAHRALPAERILEMATINGARALGLDGETGSLLRGKFADICAVGLPGERGDWREILTRDDAAPLMTIVGGSIVYPP